MPARFAVDANCMIAAVCGWHDHYGAASAEIERRLEIGEQLTVAAHALTEAYSVLTRFPGPHRLTPGDAWQLLRVSFSDTGTVVTLTARQHVAVLGRFAGAGLGGGRTYDALIAEAAVRAAATVLLTFNPRHFDPSPAGLQIRVPA